MRRIGNGYQVLLGRVATRDCATQSLLFHVLTTRPHMIYIFSSLCSLTPFLKHSCIYHTIKKGKLKFYNVKVCPYGESAYSGGQQNTEFLATFCLGKSSPRWLLSWFFRPQFVEITGELRWGMLEGSKVGLREPLSIPTITTLTLCISITSMEWLCWNDKKKKRMLNKISGSFVRGRRGRRVELAGLGWTPG